MKTLYNILEANNLVKGTNDAWIFAVIKPGSLHLAQKIVEIFEEFGWQLNQSKTKLLLLREAHELYKVHKKEPFYEDLCKYMSSGISMGLIFTHPLLRISEEMYKQTNEIKDIIREKFGESDMRNVLHSSDSFTAMQHESAIYF